MPRSAVVLVVLAGQPLTRAAEDCWSGGFTKDACCDEELYGPTGNIDCWGQEWSYEKCCALTPAKSTTGLLEPQQSVPPAAPHEALQRQSDAPTTEAAPAQVLSYSEVSRRCWRSGHNFNKCCTRSRPGGSPECWDGTAFTYERCCLPPVPPPAALLFEDVNCERGARGWQQLREDLEGLASLVGGGRLASEVGSSGGLPARASALRRQLWLLGGSCAVGALTVRLALLLLCLTQSRTCIAEWAAAAAEVRRTGASITQWVATTWPLLNFWHHILETVAQPDPDCAVKRDGIDWPHLRGAARSLGPVPDAVMRHLHSPGAQEATPYIAACEGGHQWRAVFMMNLCARTEVKCVLTYSTILDWKLRQASWSGTALQRWAMRAGEWHLAAWEADLLATTVRHSYTLGLSQSELRRPSLTAAPAAAEATAVSLACTCAWRVLLHPSAV